MSLIASVLHLDRQAVTALRLTDPYSLHRIVYSLYDDVRNDDAKIAGQTSGILYADQGGDFHVRKILLLADRSPAACIDGKYGEVFSKAIPENFLAHTQYRFQIIINPTKRENSTGKLLPIKGREEIGAWFCQKAASWGFQVLHKHLQVEKIEVLRFPSKRQHTITLAQAHLQGQLQVTDPQQFQHSFRHGIGRGRAFGCGLLQIVPLLDNPFA